MSKLAKALSAAAGNAGGDKLFVEDVFSTYLYQGNSSSPPTITNNIDLSNEGGLVWIKARTGATNHVLTDTVRGAGKELSSDVDWAEQNYTGTYGINSFNNNGFSLIGANAPTNTSAYTYASWSFRKAKGFFDIVTYTGNGTSGRTVAHSLGSVPKMVIVKNISLSGYNWQVYHTSTGNTDYLNLNDADATASFIGAWNNTSPTSTHFTLGNWAQTNDAAGSTYVAYVFGDDAIFGDDGDEQICKLDSYTGNGNNTGPIINCGFEPQWILVKKTSATGGNKSWIIVDVMRGIITGGDDAFLTPNENSAEFDFNAFSLTATGFQVITSNDYVNTNGVSYIYMAIRRPMKTPTAGTEVFDPDAYTATSNSETVTTGFPVDLFLGLQRNGTAYKNVVFDRLRTGTVGLNTASTDDDENYAQYAASLDNNTGFTDNNLTSGNQIISYAFKRASKFFDMVAWTGSTSNSTAVNHNLTVIPELAIRKRRDANQNWYVWHKDWSSNGYDGNITLNSNSEGYNNDSAFYSALTATQITQGVNNTGTFICYLFATLAGISKVGSYSGTGSAINVDCGFSNGARFILIKRANGSGDWYVYDSARGIVAGNDPYLLLNSTAVEVTNTDYIDPLASGFTVTSSAPAGLNASGGTYLFLAIA